MDLVAKEYVVCQDPEEPGVLILSRFAGAAVECATALVVNPYDPESVGTAIGQALSMPLDERRSRYEALFQVLMANDAKSWVSDRSDTAAETAELAFLGEAENQLLQ